MTWISSPTQDKSVAAASRRRVLGAASAGTTTRASTAVAMAVSTRSARGDRVVSIDHTSHTRLPGGQTRRVGDERVVELPPDGAGGLLGAGVLVDADRPAELGELGEPRRAADDGR